MACSESALECIFTLPSLQNPSIGVLGHTLRESWLDCNYRRFYFCPRLCLTGESFECRTVGK